MNKGAEVKSKGIIAAILGIILAILKLWTAHKKEQAETQTPERKAEDDKKKVNDAIINHDINTVNDMFRRL